MSVTSHAVLPVGLLAAGLTVAASGQTAPALVRAGRPTDCHALVPRVASRRRALKRRRVAREEALLRSRKATAREELLPLIDHELRTPLTTVVGYTEMLLSGDAGELNDDQERMLVSVEASGARLVELVEAVVQVAHECLASEQELDVADVVQRLGDLDTHLG
jgi:signal transduction histidine kinase